MLRLDDSAEAFTRNELVASDSCVNAELMDPVPVAAISQPDATPTVRPVAVALNPSMLSELDPSSLNFTVRELPTRRFVPR